MCGFVTSCVGLLVDNQSLSYAGLPNVDRFYVYYKSLHSLTSLPVSSKSLLAIGEAVMLIVVDTSFLKS